MKKTYAYVLAAVLSAAAGAVAHNAAAQVNVYDELKQARSKSENYAGMEARTVEDSTIKTYTPGDGKSDGQKQEGKTDKQEKK